MQHWVMRFVMRPLRAAGPSVVLLLLLATAASADASPASRWRAAVQSAPGREVLPTGGTVLPLASGNLVLAGDSSTGRLQSSELLPDGHLDPAYGEGGVSLSSITLLPWRILALPDGKLLVIGPSHNPLDELAMHARLPDWQIVRLLPDGRPDPSFGHGGLVDVSGVQVLVGGLAEPELAPDGNIVLPTMIGSTVPSKWLPGLVRVRQDGSPDPTFGRGGVLQLPGGRGASVEWFAVRPNGSIVVAVKSPGKLPGPTGSLLLGLTASGSPDASFAGGSPIALRPHVDEMLVGADGGVLLLTDESWPNVSGALIRYAADGTLDPAWGTSGVTTLGGYHTSDRLLPADDGGVLLVSLLAPVPTVAVGASKRIMRFTANGQIDPALGPEGLLVILPFGGGTYAPGAIADLTQNSFQPTDVVQRPDGTLLFYGSVESAEEQGVEGGGYEVFAASGGFALAALNSSFALDPSFGGPGSLRLRVHITSTRLNAKGIAVRLRSSSAGLCVVTVRSGGQIIARATVPFLGRPPARRIDQATTALTARIPLNAAGRRLLRRHRRLPITVTATSADLAGNHATARTSALLVS